MGRPAEEGPRRAGRGRGWGKGAGFSAVGQRREEEEAKKATRLHWPGRGRRGCPSPPGAGPSARRQSIRQAADGTSFFFSGKWWSPPLSLSPVCPSATFFFSRSPLPFPDPGACLDQPDIERAAPARLGQVRLARGRSTRLDSTRRSPGPGGRRRRRRFARAAPGSRASPSPSRPRVLRDARVRCSNRIASTRNGDEARPFLLSLLSTPACSIGSSKESNCPDNDAD